MLCVKDCKIINLKDGREFHLKGVNLGNWLLWEGWIFAGRNIPQKEFEIKFKRFNGKEEFKKFEKTFYTTFIKESDIKFIKNSLKLNCVRLPIHYKILNQNFDIIKKFISWCNKYKVYYILDLHALPGSQNPDWHSDSDGSAFFFKDKNFQLQYYDLLNKISSEFKNEEYLAGYDIMNEPVIKNKILLKNIYRKAIETIRKNSDNHIIFLEGNYWATDISFLKEFLREQNIVLSIHYYHPLEFTFNFNKSIKYPNESFTKNTMYKHLKRYKDFVDDNPIFVGEFGVNLRCDNGCYGEITYLKDLIETFKKLNFHYCYWTYKTISYDIFPTGILVYNKTSDYVSHNETTFGWEKYIKDWKKKKKDIVAVWDTKNYKLSKIGEIIKNL